MIPSIDIMPMNKLFLTCLLTLSAIGPSAAREPKESDKDIIYDEARVPAYDLPPLLVSSEGKPITTELFAKSKASYVAKRQGMDIVGFYSESLAARHFHVASAAG